MDASACLTASVAAGIGQVRIAEKDTVALEAAKTEMAYLHTALKKATAWVLQDGTVNEKADVAVGDTTDLALAAASACLSCDASGGPAVDRVHLAAAAAACYLSAAQ